MDKIKFIKQRKIFLKFLDKSGYNLDKNIPFKELYEILPAYIEAKSQRFISDFIVIPGEISPSYIYKIYVKEKAKSLSRKILENIK